MTRWFGPLLLTALVAAFACAEGSPFVPVGGDGPLRHATVTAIATGPEGFLWIGTDRGLFRYDGVALIEAPRIEDSSMTRGTPSGDTVTALLTDRFGVMWVGTRSSGLLRYDGATRRFTSVVADADRPVREVTALASDAAGGIWVGTSTAGAFRYNPADGSVERYDHDPLARASLGSPVVADLAVGDDGRVFVASPDRGLSVVHGDGRVVVHRFRAGTDGGLPTDELAALSVDDAGTLVVADRDGGVGRYDPDSGAYEPVATGARPDVPVTLLAATDDGALWVGWRDGRLVSVAGGRLEAFEVPGPVVSLARDASGLVWAGMYAGGIARYHPRSELFRRVLHKPSDARRRLVTSLAEGPDGTVWFGVDGEGLVAFDPRSETTTPVAVGDGLPGAPAVLDVDASAGALDLALGAAGYARVGRAPGAGDSPGGTGDPSARLESAWATLDVVAGLPPVTSVRRDGERLLLGTVGWGVVVQEPSGESVRHDLGGATVRAIARAGDRGFWIGTDGPALVLFDPDRGLVERKELACDSVSGDAVLTIDVQPDGALWIAAREAGVIRYAPGHGVTARLQPGVDFDAASVRGAVADRRGGVWFTTTDGLYRLDERSGRIDRYSSADGTGTDEYAAGAILRASDGAIHLGGPDGVVRFDPAALEPSDYRPPVAIVGITVAGEPVSWADLAPADSARSSDPRALTVRPGTAFAVTVAALDFSDPASLRYAYRLVSTGDDRSRTAAWVDVGAERTFGFAGLDPGSYRLHVRGTNGDGVPNPESALLDVVVADPWWRTPAAVVLSASLAMLVAAVFVGWLRARRALADVDAGLSPR